VSPTLRPDALSPRAPGPGGFPTSSPNSTYSRCKKHGVHGEAGPPPARPWPGPGGTAARRSPTPWAPVRRRPGAEWPTPCWPRSGSRGGTAHPGCGGSPRSGSPWPAAAPEHAPLARYSDGHAGVGRSSGVGPGPDASAAALQAGRMIRAGSGGAAAARVRPAPPGRPSQAVAGSLAVAAPRPRGGASAARRPSPPNSVPAARATPSPGRTSDRAVAGSWADHRGPMPPRATLQVNAYDRVSGTHTVVLGLLQPPSDELLGVVLGYRRATCRILSPCQDIPNLTRRICRVMLPDAVSSNGSMNPSRPLGRRW
jgi:hypothetical protein